MHNNNLTDWYPAEIKPCRVGWYECRYALGGEIYRYWFDGSFWVTAPEWERKLNYGNVHTQGETWRGLKEPAK